MLGFTRAEVSWLLLGELGLEMLPALLLGRLSGDQLSGLPVHLMPRGDMEFRSLF